MTGTSQSHMKRKMRVKVNGTPSTARHTTRSAAQAAAHAPHLRRLRPHNRTPMQQMNSKRLVMRTTTPRECRWVTSIRCVHDRKEAFERNFLTFHHGLCRFKMLCSGILERLGLSKKVLQKQLGNLSMMVAAAPMTSKFCIYDPPPTTPVDTFILLCKALANFLAFYTLILFVRVLLTWFPNIDWDKNPWLTLRQITDPYLNIFRNMVPPLMGQIDLTPIVGFLVMQYITAFIKFVGNRFISVDNFSDGWGGVFFFEDEDIYTGLFEDQNAAPTAPPA